MRKSTLNESAHASVYMFLSLTRWSPHRLLFIWNWMKWKEIEQIAWVILLRLNLLLGREGTGGICESTGNITISEKSTIFLSVDDEGAEIYREFTCKSQICFWCHFLRLNFPEHLSLNFLSNHCYCWSFKAYGQFCVCWH